MEYVNEMNAFLIVFRGAQMVLTSGWHSVSVDAKFNWTCSTKNNLHSSFCKLC